jgi:hypothetical protein
MRLPLMLLLLAAVGCGNSRTMQSPNGPSADKPLRETLLGMWTTSTAPEQQESATTLRFLDSGEFHSSAIVRVNGQPLTAEIDGKKQIVRTALTGTWDLEGDTIHVRITQSSIGADFKPFDYKVINATDKRLRLDKDGEILAFFRQD